MSPENQAWVEGMLGQVRKVSERRVSGLGTDLLTGGAVEDEVVPGVGISTPTAQVVGNRRRTGSFTSGRRSVGGIREESSFGRRSVAGRRSVGGVRDEKMLLLPEMLGASSGGSLQNSDTSEGEQQQQQQQQPEVVVMVEQAPTKRVFLRMASDKGKERQQQQ